MRNDIKNATNRFYGGFENRSIIMMESIWSHNDNCIGVHPGWEIFIGWMAICDSWLTIFANTENIKFTIINSKIRIDNEAIAIISCLENVEVIENKVKLRSRVVAINIFEYNKNNKKWLLIHHHGSPLSEYFPLPANV